MSETESENTLKSLIENGDLTQWGLGNAITSAAKSANNYDRQIEMERIGGDIVEIQKKEWEDLYN